LKPVSFMDVIKVTAGRIFCTLFYKTKIKPFRLIGDVIIRNSKIKVFDVIYVLADLSSLNVISPKYESPVLKKLMSLVNENSIFIDVGAHIGKYSLLLARRAKLVVAIEPDPISFSALKRAIMINKLRKIVALNIAVSDTDGQCFFYMHRWSVVSSIKVSQGSFKTILVKSMTLDSIAKTLKTRIDVIKIDVEGAEVEVIKGAKNLLTQHKPKLVMEVWEDNFNNVIDLLEGLGYKYEILEHYINERYYNILFYCE
jgi:FkbM family methyltransferase